MKVFLDEDIPIAIAEALRRAEVDALTTEEAGNCGANLIMSDFFTENG